MKMTFYMLTSLLSIHATHAAHVDHKTMAHQALDYIKQVREQTCNDTETLTLDRDALPFLMKLSDNKEFKNDVCTKESDRHCQKSDLPTSFHVELNAVTACVQGHKKPHVPHNLNKICCDAATHVEDYLETYLGKPAS